MDYSARIMVTSPPVHGRRRARRIGGVYQVLRTQLTRQFITRNRRMAFVLSVAVIAISVAAVHVSVWWFSPGVMILPILAGGLLMWPRALRIFFAVVAGALIYDAVQGKAGAGIVATIALTAVFAYVLARTRKKLGVQGLRGDRLLLVRRRFRGVVLRRQDARGRAGRRVRKGHRRRDQGPAAIRRVRRAARLGAERGVPARLQCLHAAAWRGRGGLRHRGAPVARPGL